MTRIARFTRSASAVEPDKPTAIPGARTGHLVRIDDDGVLFVDFPGNPSGPVAAKLALSDLAMSEMFYDPEDTEILLLFEENDLAKPIVVGKVRGHLPTSGIEIRVRGRRFTVETQDEIELRCGDARVRISRDGKVVVLGNDVVSRARRGNKIKGGTVNIN